MNWIQFGRLIHSIYGRNRRLPDLDWIQSLGLLAVKLGQVHALRIDFLKREKCEHLAKLYRRNAALPSEDFQKLLQVSAVPGFLDHFAGIEPNALASASVGQVHRARLKTGEAVRRRFNRSVNRLCREESGSSMAIFLHVLQDHKRAVQTVSLAKVGDMDMRNRGPSVAVLAMGGLPMIKKQHAGKLTNRRAATTGQQVNCPHYYAITQGT